VTPRLLRKPNRPIDISPMQIQRIDVYLLRLPQHYRVGGQSHTPNRLPGTDYYVEPQWVHAYSSVLKSCAVKITADDGAFGWGEVQAPLTPQTPAALITTLLGPGLLGQDALATVALHDRLYHLMLARGHTGSFIADAMAGLDIALWDLKARRYGVPLCELLGGPYRRELPAYVSGLRVAGVEEKAALARRLVAAGFQGVKLFSGADPDALKAEAHSVRAAIGAKAFLAIDAICKYDLPQARRVGAVLDELRADWFEAPLGAEDLEGHARLARSLATPVAVGETLRTPREFEPWLRAGAMAVAQPDLMRTGVTGILRIAALAGTAHVPVTLHTGVCTGIGMAASWQVAAALPGELPQEHQEDLFAIAGSVLCTPLEQRAGRLIVPERPGIGVEVDETAVRRLATEHWVVDGAGRRLESQTEG
jgi:L-alanine-DL-glutamate epimerase-like enolase superfamily enzyme